MSIELSDLTCLELNLLIEINLLLSDHVQLGNLIVDDVLSFFKGSIDLVDLFLNFFNLLLCFLDHLVAVLDLVLEMVNELLLFGFLEVVGKVVSSLRHQLLLFVTDCLELLEKVMDLL